MFLDSLSKEKYCSYYIIKNNNEIYYLQILNDSNYRIYLDLLSYSNKIKKSVFSEKIDQLHYLYFMYEDMTEYKLKSNKTIEIYEEIFNNSSFEITLKKENLVNIENIFKILDNKFNYFEIRIREIELKPIKGDIDWFILSKYYILLDCKIFLYDLQQDLFKFIDNNEVIKYGLIPKKMNQNMYCKETLLLDYNFYYGPISMLYVRSIMMLDSIDCYDKIDKLDTFNQKYFCFMTLYVYILNINLDIIINNYTVSNYINITSKIKGFANKYKAIIEK